MNEISLNKNQEYFQLQNENFPKVTENPQSPRKKEKVQRWSEGGLGVLLMSYRVVDEINRQLVSSAVGGLDCDSGVWRWSSLFTCLWCSPHLCSWALMTDTSSQKGFPSQMVGGWKDSAEIVQDQGDCGRFPVEVLWAAGRSPWGRPRTAGGIVHYIKDKWSCEMPRHVCVNTFCLSVSQHLSQPAPVQISHWPTWTAPPTTAWVQEPWGDRYLAPPPPGTHTQTHNPLFLKSTVLVAISQENERQSENSKFGIY